MGRNGEKWRRNVDKSGEVVDAATVVVGLKSACSPPGRG